MNFFFPGVGLIYVGRTLLGTLFAAGFGICFLAVLIIFLVGYARYLSAALSGDILQGDRLERMSAGFHPGWLLACMIVGVAIYGGSIIALSVIRRREAAGLVIPE